MTAAHRAGRGDRDVRRRPAVALLAVALAAVVAAGGAIERRGGEEAPPAGPAALTATTVDPRALAPLAPEAGGSGTSTWYCAGGTSREGGSADHRVVIVNPGDIPLDAVLTVFGGALAGDGAAAPPAPVVQELELAPRTRVAVRLADVLDAQFAAALVEVTGGEVVVEHVVRGEGDLDATPCATAPSATWHFPASATTRDARARLVLFNPFPDDAVVDVTFVTADGVRQPDELRGFVVPGRRVIGIDVGSAVQRHPQVSITVSTRAGRLVADRIQTFDGSAGTSGLAVTAGAPAAALVWAFPDGFKTEGLREVVTVYNPSEVAASVDVEVLVDPSPDPAVITAVEPFTLTVPAGRFVQLDVSAEDRVPPELGHAVIVRSQNGVPVVAERTIASDDPAPRTGFASTLGSPVAAEGWLTATGAAAASGDAPESLFLVVLNPSLDSIARVSVATPTPGQLLAIDGLQDLEVQPGGRLRIDLGEHINRTTLPLVVTATQPVVVERSSLPTVGGISQSIALAGAGAVVLSVDAGAATGGVAPG